MANKRVLNSLRDISPEDWLEIKLVAISMRDKGLWDHDGKAWVAAFIQWIWKHEAQLVVDAGTEGDVPPNSGLH